MSTDHLGRKLNQRTQRHADGSVERWRDVVRYAGFYRVSDHGRVKSVPRVIWTTRYGKPMRCVAGGLMLKIQPGKKGKYSHVALNRNRHMKLCKVHRLVLEAFVGPCPEGMECRHLDGNGRNNDLGNLCWGTHLENIDDRDRHGTTARGERGGHAKIQDSQIRKIVRLHRDGLSQNKIADMFGVSQPVIGFILKGKTFKHIKRKPIPKYARGCSPRSRGEMHGMTKLTDEDVRTIRREYDGVRGSYTRMARQYDVDPETIRAIVLRTRWKHIE